MTTRVCRGCSRPLRRARERAADHPGTVAEHGGRRCYSCAKKKTGGTVRHRITLGDPCATCGAPMRPGRTSLRDHPGTRRHQGKGHCEACYREALMTQRKDDARPERLTIWETPLAPPVDDPDPDVRHDAKGLQAWLEDRRRRKVPTIGIKGETL